jgi:hypothetical protein
LNYGHDSWITTYLCGALNYQVSRRPHHIPILVGYRMRYICARVQIEHHLFPGVSQYHLPGISSIVKQTCKEFNLPYRYVLSYVWPCNAYHPAYDCVLIRRYEKDFWGAFTSHIAFLKQMGAIGKQVHMD